MKNLVTEFKLRRSITVMGLIGIAFVHVLDLPSKMAEVKYLGFAYLGVIAAALILAERVIKHATRMDLLMSAGLGLSVIGGYIVNRTVGMPGAMDDIGNWLEPLGLLSLLVEALTVWQALQAARLVSASNEVEQLNELVGV